MAFLFTLGKPGVHAWDLPERPDPESVDLARYETLLIRAAGIVLEAFGLDEKELARLMKTDLKQLGIPQLRQSRL